MKTTVKPIMAGLILGASVGAVSVSADEVSGTSGDSGISLSANISLATDYLYRGLSQTTGDPALQGGFDLTHDSGFYLGIWGSNVDFADSLEIDYYGGYSGAVNEQVSFDVGVIYYDYPSDPSDPEGDFVEYYGSVSWQNLTVGLNYSSDFFAESGDAYYYHGSYEIALPMGFSATLSLALQEFDEATFGDSDDYTHYGVSIAKEVSGFELSLGFSDTDISKSDCVAGGLSRNDCDATVVFAISKSL